MQSILLSPVSGVTLAAANPWRSLLTFDLLEEKSAAILKMNNFNYYQEEERFFAFVDSAFNKIYQANIQNLILDLRDNDGVANPYGKYGDLAKPIPLADQRFRGNLFILINGKCFSSTAHLCALLKFHNIATFVGSETGGTYTCNDAKTIIPLTNTRLRLQVPQRSFAVAVEGMPKNRGIQPDYPVEPGIEDLIEGRDTILEYTLNLVKK
jgi:C-terminal processing protease CtpA/Prc